MDSIKRRVIMIAIVTIFFINATVNAQNWPQWRGPSDNNIAAPGNYPVNFTADDDIIWKVQLPGKGSSTPIVWNDRIVLTSGVGDGDEGKDGVLCFDWNGEQLWQVTLGKQIPGKHPRGSGSCPSIVTDGKRLFAYFKSGRLAALDFDGKILWKTNLRESYGDISMFWDLGTSPVLVGGNVIVAVLHEGRSYVLALEQATGKVAWKVDRIYSGNVESPQSYTTPLITTENDHTTIIIWGADHLTGHDAATGEFIWECGGFNPNNKEYWRTIASPVISQGIVIVPYGRGRYLAGVKLGGSGNITDSARLWEKKDIGTDVATPVAKDGKVYIVSFKGKIWCMDALTGNVLWQTKLPRGKGMIYSSPVIAGNKLYIAREEGAFYVCELTPTGMNVVNQTKFEDYFVATPALVRDRILLRGEKNLYCIGK